MSNENKNFNNEAAEEQATNKPEVITKKDRIKEFGSKCKAKVKKNSKKLITGAALVGIGAVGALTLRKKFDNDPICEDEWDVGAAFPEDVEDDIETLDDAE